MAKELCVLDVRSNTVTLATGECSNKGLINITGIATEEYEGYFRFLIDMNTEIFIK